MSGIINLSKPRVSSIDTILEYCRIRDDLQRYVWRLDE